MGNRNSSFLKNSFYTFTRNIAVIVLGLLTTVLLARILGPEKQGIYSLIVLLPTMLMTFLNLGVGSSTVYHLGAKKHNLKIIISTNLILAFLLSSFSIVIGAIVIWLFGNSFFSGVSVPLLLLFLSILPVLFFNSFIQSVFQGMEDFKVYNIIAIIGKIINLISLILFLYFIPLNLIGALISYAFGHLTTSVLILNIIFRRKFEFKVKYFSFEYVKDTLKYGFKTHLSNILAFFNYRVDILLISYFIGPVPVGIYNVAVQVAERLWIISTPVSTVLFPRISSSNEKEQNNLTAVVSRNILFLSIIVGIIFFLLSDIVVDIMFGAEYENASMVIKILLPGITVFSVERILSNSLAGKGKPELNLYTSIFTVTCNILLNLILIPKIGLYGAAYATSISYVLSFIIKIVIYISITKSRLTNLIFIRKSDLRVYLRFINKIVKRK